MPLYEIHFRRDFDTPKDFARMGSQVLDYRGRVLREADPTFLGLDTLEKAKAARVVSGDLVVHWSSGRVVTDPAWLWDWEKADPNCYAQRAIRWQEYRR